MQRRGLLQDAMIAEGLLEELTFQLRREVSPAQSVEVRPRQIEQPSLGTGGPGTESTTSKLPLWPSLRRKKRWPRRRA